jgi:imidazole glycerol-phosphate synthase subunit HisF
MSFRIIARLDIKPPNLVKGIHLEGLRKIGSPFSFAKKYFEEGIDEIMYQDIVATLFNQSTIYELISKTSEHTFVPLIVGGGIKSDLTAIEIIRNGADKISLNSETFVNSGLVRMISDKLGSQAVVLSIEAKKNGNGWECLTSSGREHSGIDITTKILEAEDMGAGEVWVTSIDKEGTLEGPDFELVIEARRSTRLPLIYHGGISSLDEIIKCADLGVDAVAIASALHFKKLEINAIKSKLKSSGFEVRN